MRLAFLLVSGLVVAATADDDGRKALVGSWKAVSLERGGETFPLDGEQAARLVFKADGYSIRKGSEVLEAGTYRLADGEERAIDITPTGGPDRGRTSRGIYRVEGDTFRMCLAPPGGKRPGAFASPEGSSFLLFVYERAKK